MRMKVKIDRDAEDSGRAAHKKYIAGWDYKFFSLMSVGDI